MTDHPSCFDPEAVSRLKEGLPEVDRLSHLFKVLADETRLKIVYILAQQELCVADIAEVLGSTASNVSHHLRLLRNARRQVRRAENWSTIPWTMIMWRQLSSRVSCT